MMKRAIIDLGTNSILLLIGQSHKPGSLDVLQQRYAVSRLGEQVFESGKLKVEAMERTLEVLQQYAREIQSFQVDEIHLLGTEALRRAGNVGQFRNMIRNRLGWELQVISSEQEARCSFIGAQEASHGRNEISVVMDVGGGSTEIILGQELNLLEFVSLPLGVVELAEQFQLKSQLSQAEQQQVQKIIQNRLEGVAWLKKIKSRPLLIGVGGTITTLVAFKERMTLYNPERINGYILHQEVLAEIFQSLNRLTSAQRLEQPGIIRGREDIILYGILIYLEMMDYCGFKSIIASDRGLRFGYFLYLEGLK
jgi:exopolyphosphatase/guanosine-5'-triphosphate,3'-diphosphate pyrophosphatase